MISLQLDPCESGLTLINAICCPFCDNAFGKRQLSVPATECHQKRQLCVFNARKRYEWSTSRDSNCTSTICQSSLSLCKYICKVSFKFFLISITQYLFEDGFSATWPMWVGADTNKCNMLSLLRQCFWKTAAFRSSNRMPPKTTALRFQCSKALWMIDIKKSNCISTMCQSSLSL